MDHLPHRKTTQELARELEASLRHAIHAHTFQPKSPDDAIRFWDRTTPYAVHPLWCGITLLTETTLPEKLRWQGSQALLWHDVLEDTDAGLPDPVDPEVERLVREMTFASFQEEMEKIESCRAEVKLLKLYDKVSNLLDATWMKPARWNALVDYTLKLRDFVRQTYGELNIVRIAGAICIYRE